MRWHQKISPNVERNKISIGTRKLEEIFKNCHSRFCIEYCTHIFTGMHDNRNFMIDRCAQFQYTFL